MTSRPLFGAALLALGLSAAPASRALYTGLIVIPTADTVDHRAYNVVFESDGSTRRPMEEASYLGVEVGALPRLELGMDYGLRADASPHSTGNIKYQFASGKRTQVAVGVLGVGQHLSAASYIVLTHGDGKLRGHSGVQRTNRTTRPFFGADYQQTERLQWVADTTLGRENASSVGANYAFSDQFSVMAGVIFPHEGSEKSVAVFLTWEGK